MDPYLEPYTFYSVVILITVALAVTFGFLLGMILTERRSTESTRKPIRLRL